MSDTKLELNDEELDKVSGGVKVDAEYVYNKDTGEGYRLLVDSMTAFMFVSTSGASTEAQRISALITAGYIESTPTKQL